MVRPRRTSFIAVLTICCIALLAVAPLATTAHQSVPRVQTATDSNGQSVSTCFSGEGTSFTIGSDDSTQIWVRMHAGPLTGSGWSIGAEMAGSTDGVSIIEVVAGIEYVGDGFFDFLTSPVDSFELVSGFDFQLPMLENATTGLGDGSSADENESAGTEANESAQSADSHESTADGPFEMLRC